MGQMGERNGKQITVKPMTKITDYSAYGKNYSESALWDKVKKVAQQAGVKAIYAVLLLYYVATDKNVSVADKAKIYGALGYFILPLDLIPDTIPMMGYTDDLTALTWALHAVWSNVTPEIERKAKAKLREWFGNVEESELKVF